jgi:hypothetical protein
VAARRNVDDLLALYIAVGSDQKTAAGKAGVSESTAKRRMKEPDFKARVQALRREHLDQVAGRLQALSLLAVGKLQDLLGAANEAVQLGACRTVLESMYKAAELLDLAERVANLEARQQQGESET